MCRAYFLYSVKNLEEGYVTNCYEKYPGCKLQNTSLNVVIAEHLVLERTGMADL